MSMALSGLDIPISASTKDLDADLSRAEKQAAAVEQRIAAAQAQAEAAKVAAVQKAEAAKTEAVQKRALTEQELQRKSLQEAGRSFEDLQKITKFYALATASIGAITAGIQGWHVAMALVQGDSEKINAAMAELAKTMNNIPVAGAAYGLGNAIQGTAADAAKAMGMTDGGQMEGLGRAVGFGTAIDIEQQRRAEADAAALRKELEKKGQRANAAKELGVSARASIDDQNTEAFLSTQSEKERAVLQIGIDAHKKAAEFERQQNLALSLDDTKLAAELGQAAKRAQEIAAEKTKEMRDKMAMDELERTRVIADAKRAAEQDREDAAQKEREDADRDTMDKLEQTRVVADAKRDAEEQHAKSLKKKEGDIATTQGSLEERKLRLGGYGYEADVLAAMNEADKKKAELQDKLDNDYNSDEEASLIKEQMKQVDEEKNIRIQEIGKNAFKGGQISMSRTAFGGPKNPLENKTDKTNEILEKIHREIKGGAKAS